MAKPLYLLLAIAFIAEVTYRKGLIFEHIFQKIFFKSEYPQTKRQLRGRWTLQQQQMIIDQANENHIYHLSHKNAFIKSFSERTTLDCVTDQVKGDNLALNQTTTQSSTHGEGNSSKAVDGDINHEWNSDSFTQTLEEDSPWWMVDLGHETDISLVVLYNPMNPSNRLHNFYIEILNDSGDDLKLVDRLFHSGNADKISLAQFPSGSKARYVRIRHNHEDALSLAEVEVYAMDDEIPKTVVTQCE